VSVVLVTGASSGLGGATAALLAGSGHRVYAASRRGNVDPASAALPMTMDVDDDQSVSDGVEAILLKEGVKPGQKDPPSVERLRIAQRAWVASRDAECRRRGRETEGALWARPRVQCLGELAVQRANELGDDFSRLTAR